jgi:hypothetical protein
MTKYYNPLYQIVKEELLGEYYTSKEMFEALDSFVHLNSEKVQVRFGEEIFIARNIYIKEPK